MGSWRTTAIVAVAAVIAAAVPARACDALKRVETSRTIRADRAGMAAAVKHKTDWLGLAPGEIVLTFDDGPYPAITDRIADILARHCVRGTFFQLGRRIARYPDSVRRLQAEGHTVATHTWHHLSLTWLPAAWALWEVHAPIQLLTELTGERPVLFRYPRWDRSADTDRILAALGIVPVGGDIATEDWRNDAPERSFARFKAGVLEKGRGVVVMHDVQENTPALLELILAYARENGLKVVHLQDPASDPAHAPALTAARVVDARD